MNQKSSFREDPQFVSGALTANTGIVATKLTNKAGRPAAESAEPRPGTKGNAGQQTTHRAQSRARVTQALDRVRKAARQRKKEQFTALLHHINVDTLRTAFYALKREGNWRRLLLDESLGCGSGPKVTDGERDY